MEPLSPQPWDSASQSTERFVRSLFDRVSYLLVPPQVKVVSFDDDEGVKAKALRYPLPAGLETPVPMAQMREIAMLRRDVLHAIGWRQTEETDDLLPDFLRLASGTLREVRTSHPAGGRCGCARRTPTAPWQAMGWARPVPGPRWSRSLPGGGKRRRPRRFWR